MQTQSHRRPHKTSSEKARILAESAEPEVNISEVARRNGVSRGLLNVWRRKSRLASSEGPLFVQLRLDDAVEARADAIEQPRVVARPAERIEVTIAGATSIAYDGTYGVTVTSDNMFDYPLLYNPGGAATGTITATKYSALMATATAAARRVTSPGQAQTATAVHPPPAPRPRRAALRIRRNCRRAAKRRSKRPGMKWA